MVRQRLGKKVYRFSAGDVGKAWALIDCFQKVECELRNAQICIAILFARKNQWVHSD